MINLRRKSGDPVEVEHVYRYEDGSTEVETVQAESEAPAEVETVQPEAEALTPDESHTSIRRT